MGTRVRSEPLNIHLCERARVLDTRGYLIARVGRQPRRARARFLFGLTLSLVAGVNKAHPSPSWLIPTVNYFPIA